VLGGSSAIDLECVAELFKEGIPPNKELISFVRHHEM